MPPIRYAATRAHLASDEESEHREAEQTEQSEVRELRDQIARMTEAMRHQEENMGRMMCMLEQRASPAASPVVHPVATSSTSTLIAPLTEKEQRDLTDRLTGFCQLLPPQFSGQSSEPWEMENWIAAMEMLFENFFVKEKYQVHLATHSREGCRDLVA